MWYGGAECHVAASQLKNPQFAPQLRLLSAWRLHVSPHVFMGFLHIFMLTHGALRWTGVASRMYSSVVWMGSGSTDQDKMVTDDKEIQVYFVTKISSYASTRH